MLETAPDVRRDDTSTWTLRCRINGEPVEVEIDPHETIYDTLRERLRLTGTKGACLEGECGSCTILVEGEPVTSCLVMAPQMEGKSLVTIEGLAEGDQLHRVQLSFVEAGAVQCGYCTPGLLMTAAALLEANPRPNADEVREGLAGNLCRCTGYAKIIDAVIAASDTGEA
ncbi:MAG: (2Fe-2S)-binding protein [Acidobacteriota bacterium]